MFRALIGILTLLVALAACTERTICPAYQSAFIHDKKKAVQTFHYYHEDTVNALEVSVSSKKTIVLPPRNPQVFQGTQRTAADLIRKDTTRGSDREASPALYASASPALQGSMSKPYRLSNPVLPGPALPQERYVKYNRYLLIERKSYRQALRSLNTVPMRQVLPDKLPVDSVAIKKLDSLNALDSTYRITVAREKYNVEQELYLWYLRDHIILPDQWYALTAQGGGGSAPAAVKEAKEKKERRGLKGLFKKKSKSDSSGTATTGAAAKKEKPAKSKVKKKEKKPAEQKPAKPVRKAEEDDDGF